ncbi:hypothetical protein BT69DRAFT_1279006 [Atractiella rhizophila]|nr:hypothetical protein BT69DRAFT_1279006 [Atractiella rhizophila]
MSQPYHPAGFTYKPYVPKSRQGVATPSPSTPPLRPLGKESTGVKDLPMELLELIASFLPSSSGSTETPSTFPVYRSPMAYFEPSRNPLLAFSQTCKAFRLASLLYLPHLNRAIIFSSMQNLEEVLEKKDVRKRLRRNVRHITLDFVIPIHLGADKLKKLLLALCIHPSLMKVKPDSKADEINLDSKMRSEPRAGVDGKEESIVMFPHLCGITLTSRFIASYVGWQNVHRDWAQVARTQFGLDGWGAKVLGGIQTFGAFLSGGQMIGDNWCDVEILFLEWDVEKGEGWTPEIDSRFQNVFIPPIALPSLPTHPLRLLFIPFPPSSPTRPSPLVPLPFQASHLLVSSLMTNRSLPFSPLRPLDSFAERTSAEGTQKWKDWESGEERLRLKRNPFWNFHGTVVGAVRIVEELCFSVPEPQVIDKLLELENE